jgi:hypothetical protein
VRAGIMAGLIILAGETAWAQEAAPVPDLSTPAEMVEIAPPAERLPRVWASAEYFLWWVKNDHTPGPLLTTGPAGDPHQGILGDPNTRVLYDGSSLDHMLNSGVRLFGGFWIDSEQRLGLEMSGFTLETHTISSKDYSNRTDGAPVIARPFFNVLTGQEDAEVITSPQDALGGRYLGGIDIYSDTRTWGAESNLVSRLGWLGNTRWTALAGFRYLGQRDQLRFSQSSTVLTPGTVGFLGAPAPAPDIVSIRDYFETNNNFYGGQFGGSVDIYWGRLSLTCLAKVGFGATQEELYIEGHTLLTDSTGRTLAAPGGLFTQPSNLGDFNRSRFAVVSEAGARLGYQIRPWLRATFGYTFLYWSDVVRPGEQINRNLDPRQVASNLAYGAPGNTGQPYQRFESVDFWAQGLTFGLWFRF